jgi:hypothetical protein
MDSPTFRQQCHRRLREALGRAILMVMAQAVSGLRGGKAGMITDFSPTGDRLDES